MAHTIRTKLPPMMKTLFLYLYEMSPFLQFLFFSFILHQSEQLQLLTAETNAQNSTWIDRVVLVCLWILLFASAAMLGYWNASTLDTFFFRNGWGVKDVNYLYHIIVTKLLPMMKTLFLYLPKIDPFLQFLFFSFIVYMSAQLQPVTVEINAQNSTWIDRVALVCSWILIFASAAMLGYWNASTLDTFFFRNGWGV